MAESLSFAFYFFSCACPDLRRFFAFLQLPAGEADENILKTGVTGDQPSQRQALLLKFLKQSRQQDMRSRDRQTVTPILLADRSHLRELAKNIFIQARPFRQGELHQIFKDSTLSSAAPI